MLRPVESWPLTLRRAQAPERHARPFADFSAGLADTMQQHLDTALSVTRHRLAVDFVADARSAFTTLVGYVRQGTWDEFIAQIAAPVFAWPGQKSA